MGFFNGDQKVKKVGYNQGGGQVPLPDVRVWAGDGFITGVAGGGDGTGVTRAAPLASPSGSSGTAMSVFIL